MGVLDEAIRDHLDLRRRHGASEAEIARAEAEALGPARRDPAAGLFTDDEAAVADADETTILDPVVEEEAGRALEDQFPRPAPRVDADGETAVFDLERDAVEPAGEDGAEAGFDEPPVHDEPFAEEPPIDHAPRVEEPPVDDEPVEEPQVEEPPVDDEAPIEEPRATDEEPPFHDSPAADQPPYHDPPGHERPDPEP